MITYLVIGNGVAGTTAAENIRRNDPDGQITVVSDEDLPFYYRVRLTDFLGGGIEESDLIARKKEWYAEKNISLNKRSYDLYKIKEQDGYLPYQSLDMLRQGEARCRRC